jgi:hypothetical protein
MTGDGTSRDGKPRRLSHSQQKPKQIERDKGSCGCLQQESWNQTCEERRDTPNEGGRRKNITCAEAIAKHTPWNLEGGVANQEAAEKLSELYLGQVQFGKHLRSGDRDVHP